MSLDITKGLRYTVHARDQMDDRLVDQAQVERALSDYHTSCPAEPPPNDPIGATVYDADIDGRTLKVYVENNSEPPLVPTVAWRDA
jgi:hypothetical protein